MADTKSVDQTGESIQAAASAVSDKVVSAVEGVGQGDFKAILLILEQFVLPVVSAVVLVLVGYFIARFLARIASAPVRKRVDETVGRFVSKLVFYSVMVFIVLGVLGSFGISVASFAAVVAAAGFAVGLAFQGTLSNFAAGILLLVFRPFKVGDVVSAAGIIGIVHEIDLFTTTFNTFDNRRVIVPNNKISESIIENITFFQERKIEVDVGVDYSAEIKVTREILEQAVASLGELIIEGEGRGSQVFLDSLGDSAVLWKVRCWVPSNKMWPAKEQLTEAVKVHLDKAGIGIPFPQMDVHMQGNDS